MTEAESRQSLLSRLKDRGLTVVEIQELNGFVEPAKLFHQRPPLSRQWFGGIRTGDLAIFWRELATMIAAGLPVVEALESIVEELEHVQLRRVLTDVIANMWEGLNLSQSLRRHPRVFSPIMASGVRASQRIPMSVGWSLRSASGPREPNTNGSRSSSAAARNGAAPKARPARSIPPSHRMRCVIPPRKGSAPA